MRAFIIATLCAATPAAAQFESMKLASELGSVLGSEAFCGLAYKQDVIAAYIEANAPKDDMGFASNLSLMVQGNEAQNQSLSTSAKTAHCTAITQTARHFGFID